MSARPVIDDAVSDEAVIGGTWSSEGCALTGPEFRPVDTPLRWWPHGGAHFVPLFRSDEVPRGALRVARVLGRDLVVKRDASGVVRAVLDRCPHRGVPLSSGQCVDDGIQCAYHGLVTRMDGRCGPLSIPSFALAEHAGVVWAFVGDAAHAEGKAPPVLAPFGTGETVDAVLRMEVRSHWSLVMDNAIDLTHAHLHKDVPFFFEAHRVNGVRAVDDAFSISYDGVVRDELSRRRRDEIKVSIGSDIVRLDLGRQPIIHSALTPRSADGRDLTQWWFISFRVRPWLRPFVRLAMPFVLRAMTRAFRQDVAMLEAERRAVYDEERTQHERSPLLFTAHAHLARQILRRYRADLATAPRIEMSSNALLKEVRAHSLVVLPADGAFDAVFDEHTLAARLVGVEKVTVRRHWYAALLD